MHIKRIGPSLQAGAIGTQDRRPIFTQKEFDFAQESTRADPFAESIEAGCGCIPLVVVPCVTVNHLGSSNSTHQCPPNTLEGYISLENSYPLYGTRIKDSYTSTFLPNGKRDRSRLETFIRETTNLLGEGESKSCRILKSLRSKPQAQLESILAAYFYLNKALTATLHRLTGSDLNSTSQAIRHNSLVRRTLADLARGHFLIDQRKLLETVQEVRPKEYMKVRHLLNHGANKVALALWIAKEKAKKQNL